MKRLMMCLALLLTTTMVPATHPLAGTWMGSIDTDRGQMSIGLELREDAGKLVGLVKTPHGDWPVTSVTESKGTFTVAFQSDEQKGTMTGTIKDGAFSGEWDNRPMALGTFNLKKAPAKK